MTALKRSLEIKLENILLLKIWQLVGHLLKFKSLYAFLVKVKNQLRKKNDSRKQMTAAEFF